MPQYFTLEQANEIIPKIEPLMAELLERRAKVIRARHQIEGILDDLQSNVGGPAASQMVQEFQAIERLAKKIQAHGCLLKDANAGLVDFLAKIDGREVYLCWRYGEPQIQFYHELHTGYNGRQPV